MQHRDEDRESIWGIASKDRAWFQALTLVGGVALSIMIAYLELAYRPANAAPNVVARNIIVGVGASFVASGFVAWGILQAKELTMAVADLVRDFAEKRKQKWAKEAEERRQKWEEEAEERRQKWEEEAEEHRQRLAEEDEKRRQLIEARIADEARRARESGIEAGREAGYEQGSQDTREQIQREVREKLGDESYFRLFGDGSSSQPPTGE